MQPLILKAITDVANRSLEPLVQVRILVGQPYENVEYLLARGYSTALKSKCVICLGIRIV